LSAIRAGPDPGALRATLNCIHRHLMPGVHVVIDLFDPNFEVRFTVDFKHIFTREAQEPVSGHLLRPTIGSVSY